MSSNISRSALPLWDVTLSVGSKIPRQNASGIRGNPRKVHASGFVSMESHNFP